MLVIIMFLLKCQPDVVEIPVDRKADLEVVKLPTPKKIVVSSKKKKPLMDTKKEITLDSTEMVVTKVNDTTLVYDGAHTITIDKIDHKIPYSITSKGEVTDFRLGLDYSFVNRIAQPRVTLYGITETDFNNVSIGGALIIKKTLVKYTYNPVLKEHNVGIGIRLFQIR